MYLIFRHSLELDNGLMVPDQQRNENTTYISI